jgi:predicted transcriptional regulator
MIEITTGSLEEQIIRLLQKVYPITVLEVAQRLHVPQREIEWVLQKFQVKGIVKLDPLPDKTYVRLLRHDFQFFGLKHQRKTIKHYTEKKRVIEDEPDDIMYT